MMLPASFSTGGLVMSLHNMYSFVSPGEQLIQSDDGCHLWLNATADSVMET